ncbi:MAG: transaldolase [Casimicrobiaceae bacterium]
MNTNTKKLHDLGQSLWVDKISREMLVNGTLALYIAEWSLTGLTSNPTIFEHAIGHGSFYDEAIVRLARRGESAEKLFFSLAMEDLKGAADLFRPVFEATDGLDGWVSLEVSPLLADKAAETIVAAASLHEAADRPNLFIKIPGTPEGIPAIEESIFAGVPVNVTLLFSCRHYIAAAEAYLRAIERRIAAGLDPRIASVASLFVSRWDKAVSDTLPVEQRKQVDTARARRIYRVDRDAGVDAQIAAVMAMADSRSDAAVGDGVPADLRNRLGIAMAQRTYRAYRALLASPRWRKLAAAGARPQRLLWASTGTKDPLAADTLYVEALAAPDTINTMPEKTLHAFADHGQVRATLPPDGGNAEAVLEEFRREGIDDEALALRLQREGADAFTASWRVLLARIEEKSASLAGTVA